MKKMMRNTFTLSAAVVVSAILSCTKLDESVYDSIIAESTELTSDDINNIVAPAYTSLRALYWGWHSYFDTQEESSDVIVTPIRLPRGGWDDGGVYRTMHMHTWDATQSHTRQLWSRCFAGINNANRAMYQLQQIDGLENLEIALDELRALRAFYYYVLLDHFRNVPIVDRFDVPQGFLPEQNSAAEVFAFVESELTEILPRLSEEQSAVTYGRMNRWAAKMVLAKLYLNAEVYIGTARWEDAMAQVDDIIDSKKFSLAANYKDPFITDNEGSVEQIFSIPFDEIYAKEFNYHMKTLHALSRQTFGIQAEPWGGSSAIPQFIDTYDPDDSRLDDTWLSGPQYSATGQPLILGNQPLDYTNRLTALTGSQENEGLRFIKYEIKQGSLAGLSNDVPFFRYTDALMIKAECLLRLNDATGAASIVTSIRQRAFAHTNPGKATIAGDQLTAGSRYVYGNYANGTMTSTEGGADIPYGGFLDELGWEFAGEHHRRQDLIRFGVFTTKSWFAHRPNGAHRIYFPIPQVQLDVNGNLRQNEGYN